MATSETATPAFRIELGSKEALRTAADREHRSIATMVEVVICGYCWRNGVSIPEQQALLGAEWK